MNKTKAILHICLSRGWGGLEMYPIRVGKEFLARGYKVYGLCVAGTQVAKGMQEAGLETFQVDSKNKLLLTQLFSLNRWLKQRNVEVIHCHKSGDILVSALLDLLTPRRVIFTEHMGVTRPKKDLYHRWVYRHVDQVLSISNETLKRNLNALPVPAEKIERLWLGTEVSDKPPVYTSAELHAIKQGLKIPPESLVVGTVGRVCSGKGQLDLLRAFNLIAENYPTLHLLIVGGLDVSEGSDNDFVETIQSEIRRSPASERVHMAGFQKNTQDMYAVMDIVVLPYHNEAFGLTAIEAMSAQKAIVGSNTGALPEILQGIALLCCPTDSRAIADKLTHYLDNPVLRQKNAELAHTRAREHFSMQQHIASLTHYYN